MQRRDHQPHPNAHVSRLRKPIRSCSSVHDANPLEDVLEKRSRRVRNDRHRAKRESDMHATREGDDGGEAESGSRAVSGWGPVIGPPGVKSVRCLTRKARRRHPTPDRPNLLATRATYMAGNSVTNSLLMSARWSTTSPMPSQKPVSWNGMSNSLQSDLMSTLTLGRLWRGMSGKRWWSIW